VIAIDTRRELMGKSISIWFKNPDIFQSSELLPEKQMQLPVITASSVLQEQVLPILPLKRMFRAGLKASAIILFALSLTATLNIGSASSQSLSVLTQHNDNNRTGANLNEHIFNTSNVNQKQFAKLFVRPVDGHIYAQPLYLSNIQFPDLKFHNVVYVATMHNTVYAFDADDPKASQPLWSVNLGPSVPLPDPNIGPPGFSLIHVEIGILSTPVISLANNVIYVVSANKDPNSSQPSAYTHALHALDIRTGQEMLGGPVNISAQYNGTAADAVDGVISLVDHMQLQRPALLLSNEKIYISFGSIDDLVPCHGWILAYDANTLAQVAVLNTTPDAVTPTIQLPGMGSIWQGGQGPAADAAGNVYFLTGNGDFNGYSTPTPTDLADCIVKLSPSLQLLDWFSPYNNNYLNSLDADVGSGAALLIPGTNLLVGIGKECKMYLADTNNLGHFDPTKDNLVQPPFFAYTQSDPAGSHVVRGGCVFWSSQIGEFIYVSPATAAVKAFQLTGGIIQPTSPVSQSVNIMGAAGGWMSLSSNGMTAGTGILWVSGFSPPSGPNGTLHAYNAENLQQELWNSEMNTSRDSVGLSAKFCPPTIANGKVYLATFSKYLAVYGILHHDIPGSLYLLLD
jgi:outer membrane protein assembly factor BamB